MKFIIATCLFALIVIPAFAADSIAWRTDYAEAVQDAAQSNRVLLLDFGTEACFYCKKLDATTFRDAAVARLIGEKFVPVKIDGEKEPKLVQAMKIQSYPTLVVAGPNGKVLAIHPGYLDAAGMTRFLNDAIRKLVPGTNTSAGESKQTTENDARTLLAQATKDFQDGFYLCCVERCERLARTHPRSSERDAALRLAHRAIDAGGDEVRLVSEVLRPR